MVSANVRVEGGARLRRTLTKAGVDMEDMKALNSRLGGLIAVRAASKVRSRSGRLAGSVRSAKAKGRIRVMAGRASIPWAGPIHWGWPNRPNAAKGWRGGPIEANRFLKDAADELEPVVLSEWTAGIQGLLDQVKGA